MPSRKNRRPGFALGMALMVLVVIALMGSTLVYVGTHNLDQIQLSGRQAALRHTADGGLHELLDALYRDPDHGLNRTATGTGLYAGSVGSTRYSWTFDPTASIPYCTNNLDGEDPVTGYQGRVVPAGCALLFVEARFEDGDRYPERLIIGSVSTNRFPYAIASDGVVEVDDVSSLIPGQGHVLSNNVGGSPNIDAGLVDGMTFSRDGSGSIRVDSGSGPQNYNQPKVELPDLPVQDIIASWSTAGVGGAHPYGGPADYQYGDDVTARVSKDGVITIDGVDIEAPATIFVDGEFRINGKSDWPQGVHVFCTEGFLVNGALDQITMLDPILALDHTRRSLASRKKTATPSPTPSPSPEPEPSPTPSPGPGPALSDDSNFIVSGGLIRFNGGSFQSINLLSVGGIRQNGASMMRGVFYAQNGNFEVNGNSQFQGVVITRSGTVSVEGEVDAGNTDVVYDPSVLSKLVALNARLLGRSRTVSWWIEQ